MKYTLFLIVVVSSVISGCAFTTSTQSGAAGKVNITRGPISNSCKLKGQVSVASDVSNMSTSHHSQLLDEQYSNLRSQAQQLGANTVLLSPSSGMTDKKHWATKSQHSEQAAHSYSGNAYWCPAG